MVVTVTSRKEGRKGAGGGETIPASSPPPPTPTFTRVGVGRFRSCISEWQWSSPAPNITTCTIPLYCCRKLCGGLVGVCSRLR
ncbi:hypothetical protein Pmani_005730 [Petrolisthes manimaculis]|uniref:Uncharacterized protein n=1 Tax=Petrolisthes manimaculis TaxID=1843537 RepID=A0AAE1QE09_9EUCA|nr:hypothetical protein Pmani_005730 [Petrolisthes manimaculis]